jgi:hypothetical protein
MNATLTDVPVELASRSAGGLTVSLLWYAATGSATVLVQDGLLGDCFELAIGAGDAPLDVYEHPFAYAGRR